MYILVVHFLTHLKIPTGHFTGHFTGALYWYTSLKETALLLSSDSPFLVTERTLTRCDGTPVLLTES